ncbi:DUF3618 domain-containing protein [Sinorhizobium alkalisoli]|uniref:Nutrient deprivation-induced protein n=1 Tax=Sinorhizobium alkalisoli TaxID=1752398 RepID=A0A1E3VF06_9HYPH|nr:DUF3618 domain-containing protein [Sinorhizobium alkalisoli]ODR92125.1 nutrient deprivation-induced protein [Sinorhizobium alkalisoli]
MNAYAHSAAELQREIEADREKIEARLHAIQDRMSPGQLMDEVIHYARASGGNDYLHNLGVALRSNPIPVALAGISIAWLIANPGSRAPKYNEPEPDQYPLATVNGPIKRTGPVEESFGERYSHFADERGNRFRALTDATGRRAGHFVDQGGKMYRGFADAAGKQIDDIRDETGALFEEATGWTSRTWRQVSESTSRMAHSIAETGRSVADSVRTAGGSVGEETARLNAAILKHFRDQPLVGGALAFAVGAAIGAALPRTETEDEAMGEVSDRMREELGDRASEAAGEAVAAAEDVMQKSSDAALEAHDAALERLRDTLREG